MLTERFTSGRRRATTLGGSVDAPVAAASTPHRTDGRSSRGRRIGELVARCGAGEVAALGLLYDETIGWVYPLACRAATESSTADALTMSVYLNLWTDSPAFRLGTDSAMRWVLERLAQHLGPNGAHG